MAESTTYKVVLLGDTNVGKTAILTRFAKGNFIKESEPTIGAHFMSKIMESNELGYPVKLQVWDTAGQEKYRSITPIYYRDADAAVIVFDITSALTIDNAESVWLKDLKEHSKPDCVIALAGNKSDLY